MNCKYCDNPIPLGANICPYCGGACTDNPPAPEPVATTHEQKEEAAPTSAKDTFIGCICVIGLLGLIVKIVKWLIGLMTN